MEIRNFVIRCVTFFPLIFLIGYVLFRTVLQQFFHDSFLFIFSFFVFLTIVSGVWFIRLSGKNPVKFSFYFMMFSGIKLLIHLAFLAALLIIFKDHIKQIAVFYLAMYLFFKGFEIIVLNSYSRRLN
jgi:hypothetical protein